MRPIEGIALETPPPCPSRFALYITYYSIFTRDMPEYTAKIVDENGLDLRIFHDRHVGHWERRFS
jgi:hypothetical protein